MTGTVTNKPAPGGTQYESKMHVGTRAVPARFVVNPLIRRRVFTGAMGRAWLKHNVEEVGNLEFFLPALYAAHAGRSSPEPIEG
jgi:hypothetical protein